MMLIKSFFRRIIKDFRHKELLPLKMIFFVQASTLYVLYPYLTIHMRELGINVEETAIMSAITPVIAMVMPPLAGMFADRVGNFKVLLSMFSSFGGAAALLLLLVPIGRITVEYPDRVIMDLSCPGSNELVYTMSQDSSCEDNLQPVVSSRIESCGYVCRLEARNSTEMKSIVSSREYALQRYNLDTGMNSSLKFTIGQDEMPQEKEMDLREHRKLMNNPFFKTSIRQLSMNEYFFPSNQPFEFSCTISGFIEDNEMSILGNNTSNMIYENRTLCSFNPIIDQKNNSEEQVNYHSYKSKLKMDSNRRDRYLAESIAWNGKDYQKISCGNDGSEIEKVSLILPLFNYTLGLEPYRILNSEECSKRCIVTIPRKEICSNMNTVIEYNVRLTFWLYFAIRVFISVISGTTFAMFEGAVIAILREQKADYGLQRIYGSIGGMISSPLSGLLIDYASSGKGYTDFRPAFYSYAALKLISGLLMLAINLEFKSPATNVIDDVFTVLRNVEAAALFIACFVLGTAWGYIESFLFWLIQDLGGSRSLMGITITVGGIAGIPLLVLSGPIISKIGHANVLFIGFIFYAIRLCGYSMIYNPWHTLIFEALESVTLSLSFTAAVTYAAKLSTITTDSSIQGLLGGVYYGVGKGSGSLIGGYLMKAFGTRPTYRIFAVMTLITGIMYYIFNVAYLKKRPQVEGNDIVKKTPKNLENRKETGELKNVENGTVEFNLEEKKSNEQSNDLFGIENQAFTGERENPKSFKNNETRDQWESGEQKILENGIIDADSRKINDRDFSKERENLKSCKNDETKNQSVKDMESSDNDRNVDKSDKLIKLENKKSFGAKRLKKSQTDEDDRSENGENDRDRPDVTVLEKIVSEK